MVRRQGSLVQINEKDGGATHGEGSGDERDLGPALDMMLCGWGQGL